MSFDVPEIIKERDRLREGAQGNPDYCPHFDNGICKCDKKKIEDQSFCQYARWVECHNFILHELDKIEYEN